MYEEMTQEYLTNRMLALVPDNLDKREGSVIYNAVAPMAAELAQAYIRLDCALLETFADSASREFLILRARERGIAPKEASCAVVRARFNVPVEPGERFYADDFVYTVTAHEEDDRYRMSCETAGSAPNGTTGRLVPVGYVDGLTEAEILEVIIPGEDETDTEALRSMYFDAIATKAFGGNRADYKAKALSVSGVGGVKVYRAANVKGETEGGNVLLVIQDSEYGAASGELTGRVRELFDPGDGGTGDGLAPIWHYVNVRSVDEQVINISADITYQAGYTRDDIQSRMEEAVEAYLLGLRREWQEESGLVVRISQIEHALIGLTGIVDIANTSINGSTVNLQLDEYTVPVRGEIHA